MTSPLCTSPESLSNVRRSLITRHITLPYPLLPSVTVLPSTRPLGHRGITFSCIKMSVPPYVLCTLILFKLFLYDNCEVLARSLILIGYFLSSICGQTHKFIIYALRQQAREDILTICYCKKQIDVSFLCVSPVIDEDKQLL